MGYRTFLSCCLLVWAPIRTFGFQSILEHSSSVMVLKMSSSPTLKTSVIYADDDDFNFDPGQGGVRLAKESVLCLSGTIPHNEWAKPNSFTRYTQLTLIDDGKRMPDILGQQSAQIIAIGTGREQYRDPGSGADQVIELAPLCATKDLLQKIPPSSLDDTKEYVVNLVGGDDLQVLEVLQALGQLRQGLKNISKKTLVTFSSLSHSTFPLEQVTITLIALPSGSSTNTFRDGLEKAIASGKIFSHSGKCWTVLEQDINPQLI